MEARHGSELRHLPISQLTICVSAPEGRRALWTDLSEVFWDDRSTVPGQHLLMWMQSCWCELLLVLTLKSIFFFFLFFFLLSPTELSQAVQGDGSCYGDCMMVATTPKCLSQWHPCLHLTNRRTAFFTKLFACWLSENVDTNDCKCHFFRLCFALLFFHGLINSWMIYFLHLPVVKKSLKHFLLPSSKVKASWS